MTLEEYLATLTDDQVIDYMADINADDEASNHDYGLM